MTKEQLKEQMIDDVLSDFEFEKVYRVMKELDWKWYDEGDVHVPSIYTLIKQAKELLSEAYENESSVSIGGFIADYGKGELSLIFALDERCVNREDYERRIEQD